MTFVYQDIEICLFRILKLSHGGFLKSYSPYLAFCARTSKNIDEFTQKMGKKLSIFIYSLINIT